MSSLSQVHFAVGNVRSGNVKTGKYSPSGASSYTSGGGYSTGSGKPGAKVTGSRVIYEQNPSGYGTIPVKKITTYSDGTVIYSDVKTGETTRYYAKNAPGLKPGQVSILEKDIKSYEEQEKGIIAKRKAEEDAARRREEQQKRKELLNKKSNQFKNDTRTNYKLDNYAFGGISPYKMEKAPKGFEKRLKNLQEREKRLETFTTLGGRLSPNPNKSPWSPKEVGKTVLSTPLNIAAIPVLYGGRIALFSEALYRKDYKTLFGKATIKETGRSIKESYDLTKPQGVINVGLTGLGVKGIGRARQIKVATPKTPPDIQGMTSFGLETKTTVQKAPVIRQTPDIFTKQRGKIPQTLYKTEIPRQTVTTIRGKPGQKFNVGGVSFPGGKQYTTISRNYFGTKYYTRLVRGPTGKTVTKVTRAPKKGVEKVIFERTTKTKPDIVFTSPRSMISRQDIVSGYDKRVELGRDISIQKGVSLVTKGKFDPKGTIVRLRQDVLKAQTDTPNTKIFKTDTTTSIEVGRTKYNFVDYPVEPKPFVFRKTEEGLLVKKPTTTVVKQRQGIQQRYEVGFTRRGPLRQIYLPEEKAGISFRPLQDKWLKDYMKRTTDLKTPETKQVTKTKATQTTVKVTRPSPRTGYTTDIRLSNLRPQITTTTSTVVGKLLPSLGGVKTTTSLVSQTKPKITLKQNKKTTLYTPLQTLNFKQLQVPRSITRPTTKISQRTYTLKRTRNIQTKTLQKLNLRQLQEQKIKLEQPRANKSYVMNILNTHPIDIVPKTTLLPTFGFGDTLGKKKKRKLKTSTKYRPSLTAFAFKIKGPKPKLLTGIEIRPIIR